MAKALDGKKENDKKSIDSNSVTTHFKKLHAVPDLQESQQRLSIPYIIMSSSLLSSELKKALS